MTQTRSEVSVEVRSHPECLGHVPPPGHPDPPARLRAVLERLEGEPAPPWKLLREAPVPPEAEVLGALRWVHDCAHLEKVRAACGAAPGWVDSHDCAVSRGSYAAAVTASGLALAAALDLVNGRLERALVAVRPQSHLAERSLARGFCLFNAVALAAEVVVRAWAGPVLIVDFDVHHGLGTQTLFWERADVGYLSVHRYPFFPGSGAGDEIGAGRGLGATRNLPLAAGADDDTWVGAVEAGLEELGSALRPSAVLVSAGFDAHRLDPLGGMAVTADGFARVTGAIVQAAETWAGGRVVSFLEGGHHREALAESVRAHVFALAGRRPDRSTPAREV